MSGYTDHLIRSTPSGRRRYEVVARDGGWSISLNGVCTRPFRSRKGAEQIAATLQRQADALCGRPQVERRQKSGH